MERNKNERVTEGRKKVKELSKGKKLKKEGGQGGKGGGRKEERGNKNCDRQRIDRQKKERRGEEKL